MPRLTPARALAATTSKDQIEPGSPEEAYQAINRAKMLWSFRRRDVDSWQEVINRWAVKPEAWNRIPEDSTPYRSPRRMIETELEADYDQFKEFVRIVLGEAYAAKIDEPYDTHGGNRNPEGNNQYMETGQGYVHNLDQKEDKQRGTNKAYLRKRIAEDHPDALEEIGKDRKYKTVYEAARCLGLAQDRKRMCIYEDDPAAAGRYLAQRVDNEWMLACYDAFMKSLEKR